MYAVSANGSVAEYLIDDVLDPQRTPVARRVVQSTKAGGPNRPAATVTDQHLVVANGRTIQWLDRDALIVVGTSTVDGAVEALATAADGSLLVATDERVDEVTLGSAVVRRTKLPPGFGRAIRIVAG